MNPLKVLQDYRRYQFVDSRWAIHVAMCMASIGLRKTKFPLLPGHTGAATPAPLVSPSELVPQESQETIRLIYCIFVALSAIQCAGEKLFWMSKWWATSSSSYQLGLKLSKIAPPQWVNWKNQMSNCQSLNRRDLILSQASVPLLFWLLTTAAECGNALEAIHGLRLSRREGREGTSACENLKIGSFELIRSSDLFSFQIFSVWASSQSKLKIELIEW